MTLSKIVHINLEPIDTFTLTAQNIKDGMPFEGSACPLVYMFNDQYKRIEYTDIVIDRRDIDYECEEMHMNKENSWTLFGLIHAIDHPDCPVYVFDTQTKCAEHLFGGDKGLNPPYTIEEYEHYFNLKLHGYDKAHLDEWTMNSLMNERHGLESITFCITPFKEPANV